MILDPENFYKYNSDEKKNCLMTNENGGWTEKT